MMVEKYNNTKTKQTKGKRTTKYEEWERQQKGKLDNKEIEKLIQEIGSRIKKTTVSQYIFKIEPFCADSFDSRSLFDVSTGILCFPIVLHPYKNEVLVNGVKCCFQSPDSTQDSFLIQGLYSCHIQHLHKRSATGLKLDKSLVKLQVNGYENICFRRELKTTIVPFIDPVAMENRKLEIKKQKENNTTELTPLYVVGKSDPSLLKILGFFFHHLYTFRSQNKYKSRYETLKLRKKTYDKK
jgi:hypothetical protein